MCGQVLSVALLPSPPLGNNSDSTEKVADASLQERFNPSTFSRLANTIGLAEDEPVCIGAHLVDVIPRLSNYHHSL